MFFHQVRDETLLIQRSFPCLSVVSAQNFSIPGEKHIVSAIPSSASIFEQLCQSVENDYIAHPTECKRYAYCANGKQVNETRADVCVRVSTRLNYNNDY